MNEELLHRYFQGTCTASEREEVERWLHAQEDLPPAANPAPPEVGRALWADLEQRIHEEHRVLRRQP